DPRGETAAQDRPAVETRPAAGGDGRWGTAGAARAPAGRVEVGDRLGRGEGRAGAGAGVPADAGRPAAVAAEPAVAPAAGAPAPAPTPPAGRANGAAGRRLP